jgi:hypothetical protein
LNLEIFSMIQPRRRDEKGAQLSANSTQILIIMYHWEAATELKPQ